VRSILSGYSGIALLIAAVNPVAAQTDINRIPYRQLCIRSSPSFQVNAQNAVTGTRDLQKLLSRKFLVLVRPIEIVVMATRQGRNAERHWGRPTHRRFTIQLRDDGSAVLGCQVLHGINGRSDRCPHVSFVQGAEGIREIGTWAIEGSRLCLRFSRLGDGEKMCGAIHFNGSAYALQGHSPKWGCFNGDVTMRSGAES
jgi:hypothetical protein